MLASKVKTRKARACSGEDVKPGRVEAHGTPPHVPVSSEQAFRLGVRVDTVAPSLDHWARSILQASSLLLSLV
jgi:hypothetical protein